MSFSRIFSSAVSSFALVAIPAYGQVDESALKAAYIFNFTEFTTWPSAALPDAALYVCVDKATTLGVALSKLDGKTFGGRSWAVRALTPNEGVEKCNVVVLESDGPMSRQLKDVTSSKQAVLVISDFDMGDQIPVIRLFTDDGHLRFDIDNQQALRRHLLLSSKLLRLARSVL